MAIGNINCNVSDYTRKRDMANAKLQGKAYGADKASRAPNNRDTPSGALRLLESLCKKNGIDIYKSVQSYMPAASRKTQTLDEIKAELTDMLNSMDTGPDSLCTHMAVRISDATLMELAQDPEKIVFEQMQILFCKTYGVITPAGLFFDADREEYGCKWSKAYGDTNYMLEERELREYEEETKGSFWRRIPITELKVSIENNKAAIVNDESVVSSSAVTITLPNVDISRIILGNRDYFKSDPVTGRDMRVVNAGLSEEVYARDLIAPR